MPKIRSHTVKVKLPTFAKHGEDAWAEVDKYVTVDAQYESVSMEAGEAKVSSLSGYLKNLAARQVVAWNLEDRDGKPLPITSEAMGSIARTDLDAIINALDISVEPLSSAKKKQL